MANLQEVKKQVAKTEIKTVFDFFEQKKDLIAKALPNTITTDRLIGVLTMVMKSSPQLMECTQSSLIGAVIQTVQVGLQPGNIGHVYYVPFKNKQNDGSFAKEVQFIIGYKGMIELVNRSGKACILNAECVYEKDNFQYEQGLNPILRHIPATGDRGAFAGVYCIAKNMTANEKVFVYLDKAEVEKVRNASKAGQSDYSPWAKWFDEMAKKTAVKRICKLLPLSVDVQKQISADESIKPAIAPDMVDMPSKTNYDAQDAEVVPEQAPEAVEEAPDNVQEPVDMDEPGQTRKLIDIPVGEVLSEAEFDVLDADFKANVGKNGKTTFHVKDQDGQEYYIDRWGKPSQDYVGKICTFLLIKVGEFKGKRQYMADKVVA